MIDTVEIQEGLKFVTYLKIKYRFDGIKYLVADKFGNFFMLPHCPNKRTIPFKQLSKTENYIYYHGIKKYFHNLRKQYILADELIKLPYTILV